MSQSAQGAHARTKLTPSTDQSTVSHLRMTVRDFTRISSGHIRLFVAAGVGFLVSVYGTNLRDFQIGERLIAEYPKGENPLNTTFTAIYSEHMKPEPKKESSMTDIIVAGDALSMTSLEIATLVEKRHDNVRRTIETLAESGVIRLPQIEEAEKINNLGLPQRVKLYRFTGEQGKRDSIVVVAQLSPEFTAKLVDRWQELEKQVTNQQPQTPAIPQNYSDALRLAADLNDQKKIVEAERDEAIRTKAQIGSKREASAMAAASAAKREAEKLRHELGRSQKHATVAAVEQATNQKFPRNAYVLLRRWSKKHNVKPENVIDERYGAVKAWPAGAWLEVYDINLKTLFGSPLLSESNRPRLST